MRRESTITLVIFFIVLSIPPLMFIGSALVINAIERSTEINPDEIEGVEDLYKIKSIERAIHLRIILGVLDAFSRVFTGETIMGKLYRIRDTSLNWTILEVIGIIVVVISYSVYTQYNRGY